MTTQLLPGIDKICLFSKDFEVKDKSVLAVLKDLKPGQKDEDLSLLFVDKQGEPMYGRQAKHDCLKHPNLPFWLGINKVGLSVQLNPSKCIHSFELNKDVKSISIICHGIESKFNDIGIRIPDGIESCSISRIDFTKQDTMTRDLSSYRSAYEFLQGKRMKSQGYENGYLFKNGCQQICFYDKGVESKIKDAEGLLRAESRFLDPELIRKRLGYNKLFDLFKSDANEWNEHYNKFLNEKIFNKSKQGFILDFDTELEKLKFFKESGNNSITNYLLTVGIDSILLQFGSMDFLFDLMEKAGYHRNYIPSIRKKLLKFMTLPSKGKVVSISTLINELQQKFAA